MYLENRLSHGGYRYIYYGKGGYFLLSALQYSVKRAEMSRRLGIATAAH